MQTGEDMVPQNFVEGAQNSCNPVFIEVGLRLGSETNIINTSDSLGFWKKQELICREKQGLSCISHENMGNVELGNSVFWPVLSDHADPACDNSEFTDQRRQDGSRLISECRLKDERRSKVVKELEYPS